MTSRSSPMAVLTKGTTLLYLARYREGLVLLTGGLHLAETHGPRNFAAAGAAQHQLHPAAR